MPKWVVYLSQVPPAGNPLLRLVGVNPQAALIKALGSLTALPPGKAAALVAKAPCEVASFATEQEAKVAVQTLEDAGARCQVRTLD